MDEEHPIYGLVDPIPVSIVFFSVIQHFFALAVLMLYPVIIATAADQDVQIAESLMSMTLLACGIGTVMQAFSKTGSGYIMPIVPNSSYLPASFLAIQMGGLGLLHGMLVITGAIEVIFSRFTRFFRTLFPPEVIGVVLFLVGISIVGFVIPLFFGVYSSHTSLHLPSLLVGVITLSSMICFSLLPHSTFRLYVVLLGICVGYIVSILIGILSISDFVHLISLPLIKLPHLSVAEISIDFSLIIPFTIAMICVMLKTVSNISVLDQYCSRSDTDNTHVRRGICSEGVIISLSGIIGGIGIGSSSSNTGLILGTGVATRKIGLILGIVLIAAAFFPMLTGLFYIMPEPVMGAVLLYVIVFLMINGLQSISSRLLDLKRTFVVVLPMILGLSTSVCEWVYADLPPLLSPIFASPLTVGAFSVIAFGLIMRIGTRSERTIVVDVTSDTLHKTIFQFFHDCGGAWTMDRTQVSLLTTVADQIVHYIGSHRDSRYDAVITLRRYEQKEIIVISIEYQGERVDDKIIFRYARGAVMMDQKETETGYIVTLTYMLQ